ncbi:MAG: hypothetical protein Fur0040_05320 [Sideroxydans sp.]
MSTEELSKEQRILRMMRKTLASVVKDVTPLGGRPNPLTDNTVQQIKECFALISEREKELAEQLGFDAERPYYRDGSEPEDTRIISLIKPARH